MGARVGGWHALRTAAFRSGLGLPDRVRINVLVGAVDEFVRKASNGTRNTVYFLQRPAALRTAASAAMALSPRRQQQK